MYKFYFVIIFLCSLSCIAQDNSKKITGDYLGDPLPADNARLFAPGIVSIPYNVRDFALSPAGDEIFFTLQSVTGMTILTMKRNNNVWSYPEVAGFCNEFNSLEPCFSFDGKKLYFVSNRPLTPDGDEKDFDIWITEKVNDKWNEPVNIGDPVSTSANEFYPSLTKDGTLYFCMKNDSTIGGEDLFLSEFRDGKYLPPQNLGENINTKSDEYNAFVARDGSYIIFNSHGWGAGYGSGDMWISFKNISGEFQKPINMGEKVNTGFFEYCPYVSPDEKYLFFTSNMILVKNQKEKFNYKQIMSMMMNPQNGTSNIYWIDARLISDLKNLEKIK